MLEFPLSEGAYVYRPLKKGISGWDVYALQTAINGMGGVKLLTADGVYGKYTKIAVTFVQETRALDPVDGIAGVATQAKIAQVLARKFREGWDFPNGIPYGHMEHESSLWFGNHTPPYPDGSRDFGIVQRNSNYASIVEAFDAPASIMALCTRISEKQQSYVALGNSDRRALELACGSWNAPAWTDTLARGGTLAADQKARIEAYIAAVMMYVAS